MEFDRIKQVAGDIARERLLFVHRVEGSEMMLAVGQAATARAYRDSGDPDKAAKMLAKGERYFSDTSERQHLWALAVAEVEAAVV